MTQITIQNKNRFPDGWEFTVKTPEGTEHTVTIDQSYYQDLTNGNVSVNALITESFAFLLEREPASAVLSEFNLADTEKYFPEYPEEISSRLLE